MERSEALQALKREYQQDYINEIRACRDLLASGIRGMRGPEGVLNFDNRDSFVALGQSRKRFIEQLERAVKPILDNYAHELEKEMDTLGLGSQARAGDPLMESLHDALRHLQEAHTRPAREPQASERATLPPHLAGLGNAHHN
ncbi:MAG: hypothetical protein GC150_05940 [Rhizobiales bacterium]|nr:hypothetical protein [Hyphomicrobiales bacterium]